MKHFNTVIGIDIANTSLSVSFFDGKKHLFQEIDYTKTAIKKTLITPHKKYKQEIVFVMEGTGVYQSRLAHWLHEEGFLVSIVNPLIIKRYGQMLLNRVKTDKADARLIAEYGFEYQHKLTLFKPKNNHQVAVDNIIKAIDDLLHQKNITVSQYHALQKQAYYCKESVTAYKKHLAFLQKEIKRLKKVLHILLEREFAKEYVLLRSIPGIGLKVAAMIIAIFGNFENFMTAKQACSFVGIAPSPYESGTLVKGRGSISKQGSTFARKMLFMGALSATVYNPLIRQQYQRLIQNGKNKMVALTAAANKLLRQAFGVMKSGIPFQSWSFGMI